MKNDNENNNQQFSEEQEINIRDYLNILQKRKKIIATVFTLISLIIVFLVFTKLPIYTASTELIIEKNRGKSSLNTTYFSYYDPNFIETQAKIIKSSNVSLKVVEALGLATRYKSNFIAEEDLDPSTLETIKSGMKDGIVWVRNLVANPEDKITTSKDVGYQRKTDEEVIGDMVAAGLSVKPVGETKVVKIQYSHKNPAIAQLVVNAVVKAYMDELLEIKLSTSSYSMKWMSDKAGEERDKLEQSELKLQQFMRENDLVTVENKLTILPQKLSELGSQLTKAESEKKDIQGLLLKLEKIDSRSSELESIPAFASNNILIDIRERVYKAKQNIQELSKKYGPKHPALIKAKDELKTINSEKQYEIDRIISSIKNSYLIAETKVENLKELLGATKGEMLDLNEKFMQYSIMKRDVDSNRILYETLQTGIKKESVTEQSQTVNVWVLKKADRPLYPSKPNKRRGLVLAIILGMFGGVGVAFLVEYLDNTVQDPSYLEDKYGYKVLGMITELDIEKEKIESFILKKPLSPLAESYRLVRSGLLLSSANNPPKSILVTSMNPQEGKTSTTTNLARVLNQSGYSVLIIDCDLRRPRMHSLFAIDNSFGLSTYLSGYEGESVVKKVPGEDLSMVPSGPIPPDPAELLGSERMKSFINEVTNKFDFVLLDSPPIQNVTDSLVLSQFVEGTLLVVRSGKTTFDSLESGMKKLQSVSTRVLGFVMNGVKAKETSTSSYYGYSSTYARDDD